MTSCAQLEADRSQIDRFIKALFKYAEPEGFVSLRSFREKQEGVFEISAYEVDADLNGLIDAATAMATRAARAEHPAVFAPPIAVFNNSRSAGENNLLLGLTLSVECDQNPSAARDQLQFLIGPATIIIVSGGEWVDPTTGKTEAKLHMHWRLDEPTADVESHGKLKRARALATTLVGGDATSVPISHPMRWPGTWHRKGTPRMAEIVAETNADLNLDEAIELLQEAVAARGAGSPSAQGKAGSNVDLTGSSGEVRATAELVTAILTAAEYHRPITTLAMRLLVRGLPDTDAEEYLRGIMLAVPQEIRDLKGGLTEVGRWQSRFDDIPRAVRTARGKLGERPAGDGQASSNVEGEWPEPVDFLSSTEMVGTPTLRAEHVPSAIWPFVQDTAARMGADPASVALAALVALATVTHDGFVLQPKRWDTSWTESARIWGAIVGDPSVLKTPVLRAATKPIDRLEVEARLRHAAEIRRYKVAVKAWKKEGENPDTEPREPLLERHLVEGATTEALSEVLRDDPLATQCAPSGKVLVRQDELSEFLANLDRYKTGGSGGGDRGAYLRLFNGGCYTIDRIKRGSFSISNWSATFLGGIQPEPIRRMAQSAADDGLLQRFIYVVPGVPRVGVEQAPDCEAIARYENLFPMLANMKPGQASVRVPVGRIVLHGDAQVHREAVDRLAREMSSMPDTSSRMRAAFGKWPGLFARVTLLFHMIYSAHARIRKFWGEMTRKLSDTASQ